MKPVGRNAGCMVLIMVHKVWRRVAQPQWAITTNTGLLSSATPILHLPLGRDGKEGAFGAEMQTKKQ